MENAKGASRAGFALLLSIASSTCIARSPPPALPYPSPFPTAPPPASIGPDSARGPVIVAAADVLRTALRFRGVPYLWGGDNPATGFDCSGFVRYVLAQHHMAAPRTAVEQFELGTRVDFARLRAGDLVFFSTIAPGASHVGLALNSEEFVHAPAAAGVVRIEYMRSPYWQSRFVGARRILSPTPGPSASE